MAAATKLNPAAAPFPYRYANALHLAPPAPPPFPLADAACPPNFPFVTYYCVTPPPPAGHIGFCFPAQPPSSPPALCKGGAPAAAAAAHGRPPHKLMAAFSGLCGAGKRRPAAMKPWKHPAPAAAAAAAPALVPPPPPPGKTRAARRKAAGRSEARSSNAKKAPRPQKAAGPRALAAWQAQREGPPPPPKYTTRRPLCWEPVPEPALNRYTTTVMLRNIPNKLRSGHIIELLDSHCKRANKNAGAVVSAYDVLYLPMDFRREGNFGYAFINFTTAAAARWFYFSLQWCGWKVHGSKKVIDIVPAKIQGTEALVRHFRQQRLECDKDEFLPALFSPPRDGVTAGAGNPPKRLGRLARRPKTTATAAATPPPTTTAATTPAPPPKAS